MKKKCNICGSKFVKKFNLGNHPCADTFYNNQLDAKKAIRKPLTVGYCKCHHLSLINNISGFDRYRKYDYSYTSGNSPIAISHFKDISNTIKKKIIKNKKCNLLEIASNDGTFLKNFNKNKKIKTVGIDPSSYMCRLAKKNKIKNIINDFFDNKSSNKIRKKYGNFDLIYAANVFNHIDNPYEFLRNCKNLLKKDGIVILEFPDLDQLLKKISFDTIYHEHRNYYSKRSLIRVLKKINLKLIKFENLEYMSGSLRVYVINQNFVNINYSKFQKFNLKLFNKFIEKTKFIKKSLKVFVKKFKNKNIVGVGAATKGNTLLNYCEFNSKQINCILEKSIHKIGKFTPGSAIPIISEKKSIKVDALLFLPWNINSFLKKKFLNKFKVDYISLEDIVKKYHDKNKKIKSKS